MTRLHNKKRRKKERREKPLDRMAPACCIYLSFEGLELGETRLIEAKIFAVRERRIHSWRHA